MPRPTDREFRPERLEVGDEVRYLGRWYTVMGTQLGTSVAALRLFVDGRWFTIGYRPGSWVAAVPKARAA